MIATSIQPPAHHRNNSSYRELGHYCYNLEDAIGEGFSSKVYKGLDCHTQRQVAIKAINRDILVQQINVTLLEFELEILEKMKGCPNVLEMHAIKKLAKDTYIITEVCTTDLSKILMPLLPLQLVEKYTQQLINGFQQLFSREIIHRDLKPANLLIDHEGSLKIADFGFAIKSSEARKQTKFNIGSPLYMAPEALKRNQYSHKSDIWAIGIIVYEMLTGDTPWKAENEEELYQKLESIKIEEIVRHENFPQHINDLLIRTLQFDRRYRITPQQLVKYKQELQTKRLNQQQTQRKQQQAKYEQDHYIPRLTKNTKTEKFHKMQKNGTNLHKTAKSIKDEQPSAVTIRPVVRRGSQYPIQNLEVQNKTILHVPDIERQKQKDNTHSCAKTNGSTTITTPEQPSSPKLTKQQTKAITKKLIYYIHICRLLYKVLGRMGECIETGKNQQITNALAEARERLLRLYCQVIVKHLYKVKNFASNNFLELPPSHFEEYTMSSQYRKLRKVCGEYIERYSKSDQLKFLWVQRQQPDYQTTIKQTITIISTLWPQLCQRNHSQIILLQFLVFTRGALSALQHNSIDQLPNKEEIENYVDTIPNPPTVNRFKQAITKAKKISAEKKEWEVVAQVVAKDE